MTERESFIGAIGDDPYDDAPRLVFADWLDDHGEPERAELIRLQCELEPMRDRYEIDRAALLHQREDELLWKHGEAWLGPMPWGECDWQHLFSLTGHPDNGAGFEFRRGFVDTVAMPAQTFLDLGPEVLRLHPTVRRLVLFRVHGYGQRLAACPALEGLAELELACWYSDADARAIAASPYLSRLRVLELWLGRRGALKDSRLCRIMASAKAWPRLRELTLLNPEGDNPRARKRLVKVANTAAGREVAVYRRGYPELFPFAADFRDLFPGHLPGGRKAIASIDDTTSPPNLCVVTFDHKGNQTDVVLTLPIPPDRLDLPEDREREDAMRQYLTDAIGLRPGFIRVRELRFPWDQMEWYSPSRGHEEIWEEQCGHPDEDNTWPPQEYPRGFGGQVSWLIRHGEYVLGCGDWWADKRGQVHST